MANMPPNDPPPPQETAARPSPPSGNQAPAKDAASTGPFLPGSFNIGFEVGVAASAVIFSQPPGGLASVEKWISGGIMTFLKAMRSVPREDCPELARFWMDIAFNSLSIAALSDVVHTLILLPPQSAPRVAETLISALESLTKIIAEAPTHKRKRKMASRASTAAALLSAAVPSNIGSANGDKGTTVATRADPSVRRAQVASAQLNTYTRGQGQGGSG
ncbi:hypothetical protein OQA88_7110 [Cercophora sp. LCS_1]